MNPSRYQRIVCQVLLLVSCFVIGTETEVKQSADLAFSSQLHGGNSNNNNDNVKEQRKGRSVLRTNESTHHRNLQSNGGFRLFERFCLREGDSYGTRTIIFFRAFLFRILNDVEEENEGGCDKIKCLALCGSEDLACGCDCVRRYSPSEWNEDCANTPSPSAALTISLTSSPTPSPVKTEPPEQTSSPTPSPVKTEPPKQTSSPTPSPVKTESPSTSSPVITATQPPSFRNTVNSCSADIPSSCATGKKCCDSVCIAENECCPSIDGKQCGDGSCANQPPNFGCCPDELPCGEICCTEGLKCCDNSCRLPECCGVSDPCCGSDDPCCGDLNPCCGGEKSSCLTPGTGNGDPHLTTFDGLSYDCQAEGEFILTKSLDSQFEIQGRFRRPANLKASIVEGLAIRSSDASTTVQVFVSNTVNLGIRLWVNRIEINILANNGYTSNTVVVGKSGLSEYFVYIADAALTVTVLDSPFGQHLDYKINLGGRFRNERIVGLLGSPDDNPANDWMNGAGETIQIPNTRFDLTSTPANEYCTSHWCLRDETKSVFIHANSSEFASISSGCDQQYGARPIISDPRLSDLCGMDLDCLLDGYLFGIETARSSVAAQTRHLDSTTTRFLVSPTNLVEGVDKVINVTLDLRNQLASFATDGIESFGLFAIDETTGEQESNPIATLQRLSVAGEPSPPVFVGENIDISGIPTLQAGSSQGLSARVLDTNTITISPNVTISQRRAFRVLNRFGEGKCFETKLELQTAISQYIQNNSRDSPVARKYGWPIGIWCVKRIQDFSGLFAEADAFDESLDSWDVSKATSMNSMFAGASAFNSPIHSWNVEKVKNMASMFSRATSFNIDISGWNVQNVEDMERMFYSATKFNKDLSTWKLTSIINLRDMFALATSFQQNLCNWTQWLLGREVDTLDMFRQANSCPSKSTELPDTDLIINGYQIDLCHLCTMALDTNAKLRRAVDDYLGNDTFASELYGPIGDWNVSSVTDFTSTFEGKDIFNKSLNSWDMSSATNMQRMFFGATAFEGGITFWQVDRVTDMSFMFANAASFRDDLSSWNVAHVTKMNFMFFRASNFNNNISAWDVSRVKSMERMFAYASSFNQSLCDWGNKLDSATTVTNLEGSMFQFSACPNTLSPNLNMVPPGPLCYSC